ncbi:forkhead box protein L2 [Acipenser oxyrinchus oxyrinchus]|uniref:Forkhead box protein L2 n=1 Tax=Acipenser oxyrinchus oxyrinchus TaxID=40147 RepID=A0AAD8CKY2_ACIOX|nr:forkhead box protein L2 [Acipenser oxyrinchus oxyrinchus]
MDSTCNSSGRERLGLAFTIDYLLYDKGKNTGSNKEQEGEALGREPLKPSPGPSPARSPPPERGDGGPSEEQRGERHDKPAQSYIALIAMAILESEDKKLLLGDIYQWMMNKHAHFRSKDKNWRNSVRHNLSLNECFVKAGRSDNGKGHYWAIHPANYQHFSQGDYQRRRARRRMRRATGVLGYPLPLPLHLLRRDTPPCWCCLPSPPWTGLYWSWGIPSVHRPGPTQAFL